MNNKTKLSTAILIGSAVIGATGCRVQDTKETSFNSKGTKENNKYPIINGDSLLLENRLKELANTEAKIQSFEPNAMCYAVAFNVEKEYKCPKCKKTTVSKLYIVNDIEYIREIVESIKTLGYNVILDEREFCQHCTKKQNNKDSTNLEIREPELIFMIRFSRSSNYHIVKSNIKSEYKTLLEFLKGNSKYLYGNDEIPLHIEIDKIRKMTGLGKEIITHKHYGVRGWNREEYIKLFLEGRTKEEIEKFLKQDERK